MSDLSQNMNHNFSLTHQNLNHNFGVTHQNQFQLLKGTLQGFSHVGEIVACNGVKLDWIRSSIDKNEMLIHQANRDQRERQAENQNFQKLQLKYEMEMRSAEIENRREERREDRQIREDRIEREEKIRVEDRRIRAEEQAKAEKLRVEEQTKAEKRATEDREWKERELKQQLLREDTIRREKHDEEMKRIAHDAKFELAERESQREIEILRLNQDESQFMIKALLAVFMALIFACIFVMKRSQN